MAYVEKLFNRNFLEYASYVIKDRAIPHIDDGLKPVQRRILHSLLEIDDGKFHKVANVVGHCMKYHPHGDASIASALVAIANKNLFIDRQGNFGNVFTGDDASAARYIECRVLPFAKQTLYNPDLTTYLPSYDGRNKEPLVFPAKIPVLLIQGAEGIAVGMSTKILPHNLIETLESVKARLRGRHIPIYPDFPTGGLVDASDYEEGMGSVLVRAKIDSSDPKRLIIRELPFGSSTESLIASIENAARKNKLKIGNINDYTADAVEIEIQLPRGQYANDLLDALFAFTDCEQRIPVNLLVIRDGLPSCMSVSDAIEHQARKLQSILKQELELELSQLAASIHSRTLERIFIEERIYKRIEEMESKEKIFQALLAGFEPFMKTMTQKISNDDLDRLLTIPIRRISLYDINKARSEMLAINARVKKLRLLLKDLISYAEHFLDGIIAQQKASFPRQTTLASFSRVEARTVASRNLSLRYDEEKGYVGVGLNVGKILFMVSEFDKLLIIKKDGSYSVHPVSEKQFFGRGILNILLVDKEELATVVHTLIYRNEQKQLYIKRARIEKFILEKNYQLISPQDRLLKYTTLTTGGIKLGYKAAPRLRILEETFSIADYLVRGSEARGLRLTKKDVKSIKIIRRQI